MLSICLVSQEYPPQTAHGGIGSQTQLKAVGLAALGHRVHVISRSPDHEVHEYAEGAVTITRVPGMDKQFKIYTPLADWITYSAKVAEALSLLHTSHAFDLVDFPEYGCEGFVHLLNQNIWAPLPSVIHLHGPLVMFAHALGWPEMDSDMYRVGTAMEGVCLRKATSVFSSSRCSADWVSKHYGLIRESIEVIHTGVDTDLFRPLEKSMDESLVLLFAGNINPSKGVDLLVNAAIRLAGEFPGLTIRMFGKDRSGHVTLLQEQAAAAGFPDLLDYRGYLTRVQIAEQFGKGRIFVLPSDYEGGPGLVYLEAMASGLAVVGTDGSGAVEAFVDGQTGLLVPRRDEDRLVGVLRDLLCDASLRDRLGQAGRRYVLEHADSRSCIRKIESFYQRVVSEKAGGA